MKVISKKTGKEFQATKVNEKFVHLKRKELEMTLPIGVFEEYYKEIK